MLDNKEFGVPDGDMIVGYTAQLKVLAKDGSYYWATRREGVNDCEVVGMLVVQLDDARDDFRNFPKTRVERDDQ